MAFADTRWSLVLRAGLDSPEGHQALETLCQQYIEPLKSYLLRCRFRPDSAEELTQSFFLKLIEGQFLELAQPEKGRFRTFLITALRRSVANDLRLANTVKRGGRVTLLSLDDATVVELHDRVATSHLGPDRLFDRDWALELLDRSIDEVEEKYRLNDKQNVFEVLQGALTWSSGAFDREAAAEQLGVKPGHLRVMIFRLREDFRTAVRRQILNTVASPGDVDDEMRELSLAVSGEWKV